MSPGVLMVQGAHGSTWGGAELPEVEGAGELLYKIDGAATSCPDAGATGLDCYEPEVRLLSWRSNPRPPPHAPLRAPRTRRHTHRQARSQD